MASAVDVAEHILTKYGQMSAWKLQKLVYYAQAWNLVWYEEPLFDDRIEAWANGPVVPNLYDRHRGDFIVSTVMGNAASVSAKEGDTIELIYKHYGGRTAAYLSQLTHMEAPWQIARQGVPDGVRSKNEITQASIHEYYAAL